MTRAITIFLSATDPAALTAYAEEIADLVDEAMESQEKTKQIPKGVTYDGVDIVDPDAEDEPDQEPAKVIPIEILSPEVEEK